MRLSILLATASPTYNASHETLRDVSVFEPLAASLAAQKLPAGVTVEVVVVDSLAGRREPDAMDFLPPGTLYVRAPNEWCFQNRLRHHYANRNAALASASGEVCYLLDDWCWFDDDEFHLARILDYYERGYFLGSLVDWNYGPGPDLLTPYQGRDWRMDAWPQEGGINEPEWLSDGQNWALPRAYGVQAYGREAALDIGGYDEAYDAGAAYGDLDFGVRLQVAGHRLALDIDHRVVHQRHGAPDPNVVEPDILVKCNRALYLAKNRLADGGALDPVVNKPLHPAMVEVLNSADCMFLEGPGTCANRKPCDYPHIGDVHPMFSEWLANLPKYDIRKYADALQAARTRAT